MKLLSVVASVTTAAVTWTVASAALFEPPNGRLYLSVWHENGEPSPTSPYLVKDSPRDTNLRLGRNAASYQYAQDIPLREIEGSGGVLNTGDLGSLEATETDAFFFLSVYPRIESGFDVITNADVERLAEQLFNITDPSQSDRRVFLRLYPEMNDQSRTQTLPLPILGEWHPSWHQRPVRYVQEWRRVYDAVVRRGAKDRVAFVWAPNYGVGYPFRSSSITSATVTNATEFDALDTVKDGVINQSSGDDPFSPWYPGDQYVDWVGISIYFKNFGDPSSNAAPSPDDFARYMTLSNQANPVNFYNTYARDKSKPFMISESGAAWAIRSASGTPVTCCTSRLETFQPFWRQYVTNPSVLDQYPLMKMINLFEHYKVDDGYLRDFRITANTTMNSDDAVLAAFNADLATVADRYIWANRTIRGAPTTTAGGSTTSTATTTAATAPTTSTVSITTTTSKPSAGIKGGVVSGLGVGLVGVVVALMV
ncbi:hypothetical protein HDU67_005366 [Dinochytrium kinnereticum]|nr:hypothetical protein HDU67_005366 [Dinochytrium kinnereticum]